MLPDVKHFHNFPFYFRFQADPVTFIIARNMITQLKSELYHPKYLDFKPTAGSAA